MAALKYKVGDRVKLKPGAGKHCPYMNDSSDVTLSDPFHSIEITSTEEGFYYYNGYTRSGKKLGRTCEVCIKDIHLDGLLTPQFGVGVMVRAKPDCYNDMKGGEGIIEEYFPETEYMTIRITKRSKYYRPGQLTSRTNWGPHLEIIGDSKGEIVVGSTVRVLVITGGPSKGSIGVVKHISGDDGLCVDFKGFTGGHNCSGHCGSKSGWFIDRSRVALVASGTDNKISIGDTVEVADGGRIYTTYDQWAKRVGATNWKPHNSARKGTLGTVIAIDTHSGNSNDTTVMALIEKRAGQQFIIDVEGLSLREKANPTTEVTEGNSTTMARRTFKLLKDTPTAKRGALFQEACDDGTQEYVLLNQSEALKGRENDHIGSARIYDRSLVEDQPSFFVEVFQVQPQYMTQAELDQFESFKKSLTSRTKAVKTTNSKVQKKVAKK